MQQCVSGSGMLIVTFSGEGSSSRSNEKMSRLVCVKD